MGIWTPALIGAATATATAAIILGKPRDPTFHLTSITLSTFKFHFPVLDIELILTIHVTNPNIVPIQYSASTMYIFYDGCLLGSAPIEADSQPAKSCRLIRIPARLDGIGLAHHASRLVADLARREMALDAEVDIEGTAKVLWWAHRFRVHVESHIIVDPLFLDVIDQENRSELELFVA
ncbi:late embryogenesis abundant (LEA) hydroxyproline-rich glycoprotein family [Tasmannia lanceolata]|uniref:late embryogenesis abundant (LEA) hydroxyproline-rich glycoprotein family n=1 Tax=Tasmannia lanceolata TaxID=3420 RepID=UPI0040627F0A